MVVGFLMVLVRKLPYRVLVSTQNSGGIIVLMRWQTRAFYLLSSIARLLKEVA